VAGSVWWLWSKSTPWYRPFWSILGIVAAWLVLFVGVDWESLSRAARAVSVTAMLLVTATFFFAVTYAPLAASRLDPTFDALERDATAMLAAAPTPPSSDCAEPASDIDGGELGPPDRVCVEVYDSPGRGEVRHVEFWWGGHALAYEAGSQHAFLNALCFEQLDARWWAYSHLEDGVDCPSGFSYSGAG